MNIGSLVEDNTKRFGKYESVHFEGKWHTNVEMNETANRLGNALKSLGIGKGDRVAVQMPNSLPVLSAFPAIYKIGATAVPMSPLLRPDQSAYIFRDCGAKAVITSPEYVPWTLQAQYQAPELKHVIVTDSGDISDTLFYEDLISQSSSELAIEPTDNDDLAALIYTAGTTGQPKGVMHTHFSLYINALEFYEYLLVHRPVNLRLTSYSLDPKTLRPIEMLEHTTGVDRTVISMAVLPLSHSYGIAFNNLGVLVGAKAIVLKWWNADEALKTIQTFRVSHMALVPTMYIQLLNHPDLDKYDLSSLEDCNSGAAALPKEVAQEWKRRVGVDIREGWGLTESGATTTGQPADLPPKYGSIGRCLLKCNTIKIFDENDRDLSPGQIGELVIKGPTVMKGYWNAPKETVEVLKDGWLHTGDIGYIDEEGYFYITDRKKDIIIRGGENISPREVEEVLFKHPKVAESGVVGIRNEIYGEEVKAFVVLKAGEQATESEIIAFCKDHLPTYKTPKAVQFVEAIPKNLLGKVLRAELRKLG